MPTSPAPHPHCEGPNGPWLLCEGPKRAMTRAMKSQPTTTRASSPLQRYPAHRRGSSEAISGLGGRRAKKPPSLRLATVPSGAIAEPPKRGKVRLAPHAQRRARKHARARPGLLQCTLTRAQASPPPARRHLRASAAADVDGERPRARPAIASLHRQHQIPAAAHLPPTTTISLTT
jgi:hypothetical protein